MTEKGTVPLALLLAAALLGWGTLLPAPAGAANGCAGGGRSRPDEGGVGGTGALPGPGEDDSGVGGTGARPQGPADDSGVGGTGVSAQNETGIIGTITGFASICVGEVEIHYDAGSAVRIDGEPATPAQLAVGQVVEVVAGGTGAELRAQQITVRHLVAGPVIRADAARNQLDVIGQTVQLAAATRSAEAGEERIASAADFSPGTVVQVSGMRQGNGVVVASLVTRNHAAPAQLTGAVAAGAHGWTIAGTPVRIEDRVRIAAGDEVRAAGRWENGELLASAIESLPRLPFDGRVARLEIEGYARLDAPDQLRVGPFVFDLPRSLPPDAVPPLDADARVRIEAVVRDRQAIVERIGAAPDMPERPDSRPGGRDGAMHRPGGGRSDDPDRAASEHPPSRDGGDRPPGPGGPDLAAPARPDRPDRPSGPELPERAPRVERPPLPDRPSRPDRPDLPDRPPRPVRP